MEYGISKLRRTTEFGRSTHGIFQNQELIALTYDRPTAENIVQCLGTAASLNERVEVLEAKVFPGDSNAGGPPK